MTKPPRVGICLGRSKAYLCLKFSGRSRPRLKHFLKIRPLDFYAAQWIRIQIESVFSNFVRIHTGKNIINQRKMYKIEDKIHHSDTQMTIKKIPVPLFTYSIQYILQFEKKKKCTTIFFVSNYLTFSFVTSITRT